RAGAGGEDEHPQRRPAAGEQREARHGRKRGAEQVEVSLRAVDAMEHGQRGPERQQGDEQVAERWGPAEPASPGRGGGSGHGTPPTDEGSGGSAALNPPGGGSESPRGRTAKILPGCVSLRVGDSYRGWHVADHRSFRARPA